MRLGKNTTARVLTAGFILLLISACSQQPTQATLPTENDVPFTRLAPGFSYRDYSAGLTVEQNFLAFTEATVPAVEAKVATLRGRANTTSDELKLQAWERALREAREAYTVVRSSEAQRILNNFSHDGQLTVQQRNSCAVAATARDLTSGSGAKAEASATCSGLLGARFYTEAKANARAGGKLKRDSDTGGSFSRAAASQSGTYACGSDAYARGELDPSAGINIPLGSRQDTHTGC